CSAASVVRSVRAGGKGALMEYISGASSWRSALRQAAGVLLPRRAAERRRGWSWGVPVVLMLAGLLFTTTATTAGGTELRNDRRPELAGVIAERKRDVADAEARAAALRRDLEAQTGAQAGSDARVAEQRA